MRTPFFRPAIRLVFCISALSLTATSRAANPSVEQALRVVPSQQGVDYDRPKAEDVPRCKISAKKIDGHVGWIVESPEGILLRKFLDTDGDNIVDQWSYYKDGVEVYRELATKSGAKANEFRWLNAGGTRWGVDTDGSGRITAWKEISAEETTAEIVAALATRDADRFARVLATNDDIASLGLGKAKADALAAKVAKAAADFRALADRQKTITAEAKWLQFSGSRPGVVPAGTDESTRDVEAYENVVAIVQLGDKNAQVQIGELVRVGKTWKTIDAPALSDGQPEVAARGGFLIPTSPVVPAAVASAMAAGPADDEVQKIIAKINGLDPSDPQRLVLIQQIIDRAKSADERAIWSRQLADTLSAGAQTGKLADGDKQLQTLFEKAQTAGDTNLAAYIKIRMLTAGYAKSLQDSKGDGKFPEIQAQWTKDLAQFIEDYPKSPDAAEAMLQLGIAREYAGQDDEAKKLYERIGREFADAPQAKKAAGAVRRLASVGTVLELSGRGLSGQNVDLANYRGKIVLVEFWSTWSLAAKNEMPLLKQLAGKYRNFTVVGVNLDANVKDLRAYLTDNPLPWEQIYEEGGQDSRPANALGIITVPTMILVDGDGKVLNRNIQANELEAELKKLAP